LIRNAESLWRFTAQLARETVPEPFLSYPYMGELDLGWYPSKAFFEPHCDPNFAKVLPDLMGAAFPYFSPGGTFSHLVIASYRSDGSLSTSRRASVYMGAAVKGPSIFGHQRLKRQTTCLAPSNDETLVCKHPGVIALSGVSDKLASAILKCTPVVNLRSDEPRWRESMMTLAHHGLQISVEGVPLVDHVSAVIIGMFEANLGNAVITHKVKRLLANLIPIERIAVIHQVKVKTGADINVLVCDDFHIYKREAEFYAVLDRQFTETFERIELVNGALHLHDRNGRSWQCPLAPLAIQATICQIFETGYDLMDWVQATLVEVPHFYRYRDRKLESRSVVCQHLAEIVITVLLRHARISP
jgi:hypothetical protein